MYIVDNKGFDAGIQWLNEWFELKLDSLEFRITSLQGKKNSFLKREETFEIEYVHTADFYRMLVMGIKSGLSYYEEEKGFDRRLTYMLDCSRNAVINLSSVKRLIGHLCVMGYTELSLYTEDTYEVQNEPCFGYLRGRFSPEEIREIVQCADVFGMTATLSIQCLAHMRSIYRYETYYQEAIDCNDVLMVGSERTEELLENIFATIAQLIPSKTVNIGMDEPFMLGRGKYLNRNGYVAPGKLFLEQLKTVVRIAAKYDLKIKMWGDSLDSNYENRDEIIEFAKKSGVKFILWYYGGAGEGERSVEQVTSEITDYLNKHKSLYSNSCFCMSDHKYLGLAPHNNLALHIDKACVEAAINCEMDELWLSSWGDSGAEVSPFATLPVMAYVGYGMRYNRDFLSFEKFFNCLFGSLNAFLKLDYANCLNAELNMKCNTSSKYFLYQDVFMGVMDKSVGKEFEDIYLHHIEELETVKCQVPQRYAYVFETQICLLRVLLEKHNLGNKTREAFLAGDKGKILALLPIYQNVILNIRKYFEAFRTQWYRDNKVFGFEIQEARIGALIFRLGNCAERLKNYCEGEIDDIPEIREEILDLFGTGENILMLNWGELISAGVMIEYFSFV